MLTKRSNKLLSPLTNRKKPEQAENPIKSRQVKINIMKKILTVIVIILLSVSSILAQNKSSNQIEQKYRYWYKISTMDIGIGYGTSYSADLLSNEKGYKMHGSVSLGEFAIGFQKLAGLGFGTKVFTYNGINPKVEINSWVPLYVYLPVYISKKTTKPLGYNDTYNSTSMVYLYAGGSLWCTKNGYLAEEPFIPTKFYQLGVNYMFLNFTGDEIYSNGNLAIGASIIFYPNFDQKMRNVFNIKLIGTIAGVSRTKY